MAPGLIPTPLNTENIEFQDTGEEDRPMSRSGYDTRAIEPSGPTPIPGTAGTGVRQPGMPPSNGKTGKELEPAPQTTLYPPEDEAQDGRRADSFQPTDRPPSPLPNVVSVEVPSERGPGGGESALGAPGAQAGDSRGTSAEGRRAGFGSGGVEGGGSAHDGVEMQPMPPLPLSTKSRVGSRPEATSPPAPGRILLHGTLHVTVHEARNLPHKKLGRGIRAKALPAVVDACIGGTGKAMCGVRHAKAYVVVELGNVRRARTQVVGHTHDPVWEDAFTILVADEVSEVSFVIKDEEFVGAPMLAKVVLPASELVSGKEIKGQWLPMTGGFLDHRHKPPEHKPELKLTISYEPVSNSLDYGKGIIITGDKVGEDGGLRGTYFPPRHGCRIHLYNDAHQDLGTSPEGDILLEGGKKYEGGSYFTDLFNDIQHARVLIYITGWSVYDKIHLIRDPSKRCEDLDPATNPTLGELLKRKAKEGVRVCLLVWDDRTSLNFGGLVAPGGVMATHDEATRKFFRYSSVHCVLCPRDSSRMDSVMKKLKKSNFYTHHQKSVILDVGSTVTGGREGKGGRTLVRSDEIQKRRLVSYVGGIDLTGGRYDDRNHALFSTLKTLHSNDYYQGCIDGPSPDKDPRQPWHDIHCRAEGPIAWDLHHNFVQRWRRQSGIRHRWDLAKLDRVPELHVPQMARGVASEDVKDPEVMVSGDNAKDPERWTAQLFRSIDRASADFARDMQDNVERVARLGLASTKHSVVEYSIQEAYVFAIRRARRFIYIENQYFLGSAYAWKGYKSNDEGPNHIVPMEIALKVADKIRGGEPFTVYVVLPMWSEGVPTTQSVQEILAFQRHTIRLMYHVIARALQETGTRGHPRDYLAFFCLGNREPLPGGESAPVDPAGRKAEDLAAHQTRRFQIYVHSKLMIVDDEFLLVGSANINQRSMDGQRDTELCVGAFQPHHTAGNNPDHNPARGQIYGFRNTLWEEHLGELDEEFQHPEASSCMQKVAELAQENWEAYIGSDIVQLPHGHLLPYPLEIAEDGGVSSLPGFHCFPDTKAAVMGAPSNTLPDLLTG